MLQFPNFATLTQINLKLFSTLGSTALRAELLALKGKGSFVFIRIAEFEFPTLRFTFSHTFTANWLKGALAEDHLREPQPLVHKADARSTELRKPAPNRSAKKKVCQSSLGELVEKLAISYIAAGCKIISTPVEGSLVIASKIMYTISSLDQQFSLYL